MNSYVISVKSPEGIWKYRRVPPEVFTYIKQLEACVNNPEVSKLKTLYPERFKNAPIKA